MFQLLIKLGRECTQLTSKRHIKQRECGSKHRYADEATAKHAAYSLMLRQYQCGRDGGIEQYKCKWCHHWHIGHLQYQNQWKYNPQDGAQL